MRHTTDELIMVILGMAGVITAVAVMGTGEFHWYYGLALVAFAAMIPLSSLFRS